MALRRANIRKKGSKYYGRWYDSDGNRHERALSTDSREAARLLNEIVRNVDRVKAGLAEEVLQKQRFWEVAEAYFVAKEPDWTPKHAHDTWVALKLLNKLMRRPLVGSINAKLLIEVRARIAETRSNRTANKHGDVLQACMRWAEIHQLIGRSPLGRVQRLPEGGKFATRKRRRLTHEEAAKLQLVADQDVGRPTGLMVAIALSTGFRLSEILNLNWADWDGSTLSINESKNGDPRSNPVDSDMKRRLRGEKLRRRLPGPDEPIVVGPRGGRRVGQRISARWLQAILGEAGLDGVDAEGRTVDWHALRHSYCTWLREAGVDLGTAALLMGHRSLEMTQRIYSDASRIKKPKVDAVAALEAARLGANRGQAMRGRRK